MVYIPSPAFQSILSFCDNRIEQNQKIQLAKCLAIIKHLRLVTDMIKLDMCIDDIRNGYFTSKELLTKDYHEDLDFNKDVVIDPLTHPFSTLLMKLHNIYMKPNTSGHYMCNWIYERKEWISI